MLHYRENLLPHQPLAYQKQSIDQWQLVDIEIEQWDETCNRRVIFSNRKVIFKVFALRNTVIFVTLNWLYITAVVKYKVLSGLIKQRLRRVSLQIQYKTKQYLFLLLLCFFQSEVLVTRPLGSRIFLECLEVECKVYFKW